MRLNSTQFSHYSLSLFSDSFLTFPSVDHLEHLSYQLYLRTKRYREHITVKVHGAALALGFGEYFSHGFQHTKALVTNYQFNPIQATPTQPLEGPAPTGLVLLHTLCSIKNLSIRLH